MVVEARYPRDAAELEKLTAQQDSNCMEAGDKVAGNTEAAINAAADTEAGSKEACGKPGDGRVAASKAATSSENEEAECGVCFKPCGRLQLTAWVVFPCGHAICRSCLLALVQAQQAAASCPFCRRPLVQRVEAQERKATRSQAPEQRRPALEPVGVPGVGDTGAAAAGVAAAAAAMLW